VKHEKVKAKAYENWRGSSHQRGYGGRWRALSQSVRRRYPLCGDRPPGAPETRDSVCKAEGRVGLGEHCDHIVPVTGPDDLKFYDKSNLQVLCARCHQAKRGRERHG